MWRVRVREDCRWATVVVAGREFSKLQETLIDEGSLPAIVQAELLGSEMLEVRPSPLAPLPGMERGKGEKGEEG
jgi:hypothetical protein